MSETVEVNDLVLIYVSDSPAAYARVEEMEPDVKPGWWRVRLLVLTVPIQEVTWILQREQINGTPFTMGGTPVRLEKVVPPSSVKGDRRKVEVETQKMEPSEGAKVISLKDRQKPQDKR
jgi:hypothetical protein